MYSYDDMDARGNSIHVYFFISNLPNLLIIDGLFVIAVCPYHQNIMKVGEVTLIQLHGKQITNLII
jgi:hypothetical protein